MGMISGIFSFLIMKTIRKKHPDLSELAYAIASEATGKIQQPEQEDTRNPAAVELGRLGGLKGTHGKTFQRGTIQNS
jgi:hypothetical protein